MKITRLVTGLFALLLLLPVQVSAEYINIYPGPVTDEYGVPIIDPITGDWSYVYDYGDVEVGASDILTFQIENDPTAGTDLWTFILEIENDPTASFSITSLPDLSEGIGPGESIYVDVTFTPTAVGDHSAALRIYSNASNDPPGTDIHYALQGMGIPYVPTAEELMTELLEFFEQAEESGDIVGVGSSRGAVKAHLKVFERLLANAADLIEAGDYASACGVFTDAALRADGIHPPPDFVEGEEIPTLNAMILEVMDALGC